MDYGQIGLVDGLGFGLALLLEVPSGAIADLFGKKKTILFAMFIGAIGTSLVAFANSFLAIFVGWMLAQVCFAFYSGAGEALAYDSLVDLKREKEYDKVISKSQGVLLFGLAASVFLGGLLYNVNFRLPHVLWALSYVPAFFAALFLVEPKTDTEKFSLNKYFEKIATGVKELFQPGLRKYFLLFLLLLGIYFMYDWSFIRPTMATNFGFFATEQGVIIPVLYILSALLLRMIPRLRKCLSETSGLVIFSLLMAVGFMISSFPIGVFGIIAMILIEISGSLSYPWISVIVNERTSSGSRATTISTIALISKIPYVALAIFAGNLVQQGKMNDFAMGIGISLICVIFLSLTLFALKKAPSTQSI
jgi:MFS family permease